MDIGLGMLLASLASPLMGAIVGSGKPATTNWISPSMGVQDPYLLQSMYKRGLQYGIGDQGMYKDISQMIYENWPQMMSYYGNRVNPGHRHHTWGGQGG